MPNPTSVSEPTTPLPTFDSYAQAEVFVNLLLGYKTIGVTHDSEPVDVDISPEARVFLQGLMGAHFVGKLGWYGYKRLPALISVFKSLAAQLQAHLDAKLTPGKGA